MKKDDCRGVVSWVLFVVGHVQEHSPVNDIENEEAQGKGPPGPLVDLVKMSQLVSGRLKRHLLATFARVWLERSRLQPYPLHASRSVAQEVVVQSRGCVRLFPAARVVWHCQLLPVFQLMIRFVMLDQFSPFYFYVSSEPQSMFF